MAIPSEPAARLAGLIERFLFEVRRAAQNPGPEEVHDVRVSVRRLEQALEVFAAWLPPRRVQPVCRLLGRTLELAGEVRDCDIALELREQLQLQLDQTVSSGLQSARDRASTRFVVALNRLANLELGARWKSALGLESPGDDSLTPMDDLAVSALPDLAGRFIKSGARLAHRPQSRRRLHKFRVCAKRFRYALELFADRYGPTLDQRITSVRKIQNALGDLQDCVATRHMLRDWKVPRDVRKPLRREEADRLERFQKLWPKLFPDHARAEWSAMFRPSAAVPPHAPGGCATTDRAATVSEVCRSLSYRVPASKLVHLGQLCIEWN